MILKLIIITSVIVIFVVFISYQIEGFSIKNYINTEFISPEYTNIYSYLPYDIISKNKESQIYDFGNDELNELFRKKFNIDYKKIISLTEGINWSKWNEINEINQSTRLYNYYSNVISDLNKTLNKECFKIDNTPYTIIKHHLNKYKIAEDNSNTYLLDISVLLYRQNRPLAKHIKILCVCNGVYTNFLMIKVIGVVPECQLKSSIANCNINNLHDNYSYFIPTEYINYDMNSYIFDLNDKLSNSQVELNLYNKLLKDLL